MDEIKLYEEEYKKKKHFSFGKNWTEYARHINKERIEEAKKSLGDLLGGTNEINGKSFIDIGCGSGLFSLAACLLGAKKVVSIDVDEYSLKCTELLREKNQQKEWQWEIKHGSALDENFLHSLGKFDVVYSWGVLHHTGNMWKAIGNTLQQVKSNGKLCIAIYNENKKYKLEGTSKFWHGVKKFYNNTNSFNKKIMCWGYTLYLITGLIATGRNPVRYIKNYKAQRGMNFFTDIKDWLGGFPYEYATPEKITEYVEAEGFVLVNIKKVRSIGCNEFVFKKKES
ncbi:class I SAM-dependent methyltransferase [Candidatus Woesearchaeota archaeon]|nr:class I SAM-dependent methyltransferase [Candidatus Woesearchaeota archaeon]